MDVALRALAENVREALPCSIELPAGAGKTQIVAALAATAAEHQERPLEVLTKWEVPQPSPADDGAGEAEEGFVDVVADLPAGPQPPEPVQQRDGLLHHPAVGAQPRAMRRAAPGDHGGNALGPDLRAVLVVVIAPVGVEGIRAPARPAAA